MFWKSPLLSGATLDDLHRLENAAACAFVSQTHFTSMAADRKSYGTHFAAASVAGNYVHRPPYPPEVYAMLEGLLPSDARTLLDAGCGPGKIALGLAPLCERIDAIDPSGEMLALGRAQPGGNDPKIHWQQATVEDATLTPPYGLITAGASFHWMDATKVLSLFADVLT